MTTEFCDDNCKIIYHSSSDIFCKMCGNLLGKSSVVKKQFCNLQCSNLFQREKNKVKHICIVCNKEFIVQKSSKRMKLCSIECEKKYTSSDIRNKKRMESLEKNNLKKYGVKSTFELKENIEKSKNTKLQKYGNSGYNNINKIKQTKLDKYGDENYINVEKIKTTKLQKYGTLDFNEKSNKTKLEKYGTLDFSDKAKKTTIEKYGTLDFSKKSKETIILKYGSYSNIFLKKSYIRMKNKYESIVEFLFDESEYKSAYGYKKYPFKCKKCDVNFDDYMTNGLSPKCPVCNPYIQSKPQEEIYNYLKELLISTEVVKNTRSILFSGKELDIYIPSKKIAIEFNGIYWHSEMTGGKGKNYHLDKTNDCEKQGIRLIHIMEDEWTYRQDIVKSKLKHICNISTDKSVYARNCIIKEIDGKDSNLFLDKYHIQGCDKASIKIGAYNNNELIAVMTFGKNRVALGNNVQQNCYEMYRFCTSKNVVGIGGKLLKYFINNYKPKKIISYADRRYSYNNAFYNKIGFKCVGNTSPNYWYFHSDNKLILFHRFNFRKDSLNKKLEKFDNNLSEWQNMQNNGYDRIWDCGHYKYEWNVE